jgi:hypothetical protein
MKTIIIGFKRSIRLFREFNAAIKYKKMKTFIRLNYLLIFTLGMGLSSCIKNNPDPAWLEVKEWTLVANPELNGLEGELTHNFSEAVIYVNDENIGVFEVPFKIPVLKSGDVNIKIYPAIRNNGISATKKNYPFVEFFEINTILTENQTLTINPTTKYKSLSKFWIEDFEDSFIKLETDPNSATGMVNGNNPSILKWGNSYGVVNLDASDSSWIAYSLDDLYLPKGQEVYLELNYYCTNSVTTGLLAIGPSGVTPNPYIRLNSQDPNSVKWKKIYIDLREIISSSSNAVYFKPSFQAYIDDKNFQGQIILDNIKVVHF